VFTENMWKIIDKQKDATKEDIERLAEYQGWHLIEEENKWLEEYE
jgi:hypothetical protein